MWRPLSAFLLIAARTVSGQPPPQFVGGIPHPPLPPGELTSLATDHEGFLWIATDHGLCRFDGSDLDLFRHIPGDSTSISSNGVRKLFLDPHGRLWVAGNGLCYRSPGASGFTQVPLRTGQGPVSMFECLDLSMDAGGTLWGAGVAHGLLRYDTGSGMMEALAPSSVEGRSHAFSSAVLAQDDGTWYLDGTALVHFDPTSEERTVHLFRPGGAKPPLKTLFIRLLHTAADPEALWIGGWGLGLVRFDKATRTFEGPYLWGSGEPTLTNLVIGLLDWSSDGLLVGTNDGVKYFDLHTRRYGTSIPWGGNGTIPAEAPVSALFRSSDGTVWAGRQGHLGIVPAPKCTVLDIGADAALRMVHDRAGTGYWAVRFYHHRSLLHLDSLGREDAAYGLPGAEIEKYEPFHVLCTRGGAVWVGTTRGALLLGPGDRAPERLLREGRRVGREGTAYVTGFLELDDGRVLIGTLDEGLWCWDPRADTVAHLPHTALNQGRPVLWGSPVHQLDADHVVLAFPHTGVGVCDLRGGDFQVFGADRPGLEAISDLVGTACHERQVHVITRTNGVYGLRWNGPDGAEAFTVEGQHMLPDQWDVFADGVCDDNGIVWIASTDGLVRFEPGTGRFARWGPLQGFPMNALSAVYEDGPDRLLAQGRQVVRFRTDAHSTRTSPPELYLRHLVVNGREQSTEGATRPDGIILPHDRNTLTIGFAAIDLLHAEGLRYQVKLEGRDADWVDNGKARTVTYVDLPPGAYTLALRTEASTAPPFTCRITIVPAYWQTWWFRLAMTLLLATGIFLISRYIIVLRYRRRIAELQREQEVQRTRMRIARDIHDGIGGGLTRIALLSRRIPGQGPDSAAARITEASTELVRELGEIVWTVDPGNDARSAFIAFVRSTLGRQFDDLDILLEQDLHVNESEGALPLPPDVKRNTLLILKEAVNNALKHANARTIMVRLYIEGPRLELEVEDDGQGFDPALSARTGNGLSNFRKRAEAAGGNVTVLSTPGEGTRIRFIAEGLPTFM